MENFYKKLSDFIFSPVMNIETIKQQQPGWKSEGHRLKAQPLLTLNDSQSGFKTSYHESQKSLYLCYFAFQLQSFFFNPAGHISPS